MWNIFRYLKRCKGTVLVILILLIIQAFCDLALPTYTSNIVDVGISQNGIEERVPEQIRQSSLMDLQLFLNEEEEAFLKKCYEKTDETVLAAPSLFGQAAVERYGGYLDQMEAAQQNALTEDAAAAQQSGMPAADSAMAAKQQMGALSAVLSQSMDAEKEETAIYRLRDNLSGEDLERLETLLEKPEMFYGMMGSALAGEENGEEQNMEISDEEMEEMFVQVTELLNPDTENERRMEILGEMLKRYESMWDTMSKSLTAMYIREEYKAQGVNMERYQKSYLLKTGMKMLGVSLGIMATMILAGLLASRAAAKIAMELRNKMFANVLTFSNKELNQFSTASLITRSTNDIQQVQMVLVMLLRMVFYAPILGIGAVFKVLNNETSMAWIIGVAILAIFCLVVVLFVAVMPKFKRMQILVDKLNQVAREILTGLPVIRAFSRETHEEERFAQANGNLMKTQLFTNRVMTTMMPAMMLIMYLINVMILWFGAKGIDAGHLQVGDMMAFITYTMQIVMSFLMLTMISIILPRAGVAAKRIDEVIAAVPEIVDSDTAKTAVDKKGEVTFEHVDFIYPDAEGKVLTDISFTARPGETTAIIGGAGSGKSTLVNLIPRFYDVSSGKITIDGTDVRELKQEELRSMLGYVPQKGVLFSGTIESNIKFGNQEASEELVREAAGIAQAADFIEEKLKQYKSEIAQGGTNVSGGQKQRLSIARAIAREPKIYIFDDSFSALDFKTDAALRKALKEKTRESTVLLVAQRISTIMHAEQIIVLDDGEMVGKGTHQELLQTCEVYQQIASSQLSQSELEQTKAVKSSGKEEA